MNYLILAEGTVTPSCSKSHIAYTLHLKRAVDQLHVEFAYTPKLLEDHNRSQELIVEGLRQYIEEEHRPRYLENWEANLPLNNLLTLSFDDDNGFRGAGHRHDPQQHLQMGLERTSPGLVPGSIPAGQLRITISVHCVVSDECRYKLKVWEGGGRNDRVAAIRAAYAYVP